MQPEILSHANAKNQDALLKVIVGAALVAVIVLYFMAFRYPTYQIPPEVWHFRWNPYVTLSLFGVLCNVSLLVFIARPKLKTTETPWFSFYLVMNVIWGAGEAATRLSVTPAGAIFWWHFEAIGLGVAPCAFFLFALAYTYQDNFVRYVTPVVTMITLGLILTYLFLATGVLIDKNPAHATLTGWGYYPAYPNTYWPILIWLLAAYAGSQALIIGRFRRTRDWQQAKLFIIGALIPLVIGLITDAILPAFGEFFPPSAVPATAIFAVIVAYTVKRYGLLRLNLRTFAPGLLQTMSESVIVTDPQLRIEFFNTSAISLLNAGAATLEAKSLHTLFSATQMQEIQRQVVDALESEQIAHFNDAEVRSFGGQNIPISVSATKVLDTQSRLAGYSFVFTDLRQIKAAERQLVLEKQSVERKVRQRTAELSEARAELEASVRSLPFGFGIITPQNEIVFANSQLGHLLGHRLPSDPSSREVLAKVSADYQDSIDILGCLHEAQTRAQPIEKNISYGPRFFRFFFMPILDRHDDKSSLGSVLIVEDTTDAKALERSRDEFFSIASHELRTPLTAIRGNTDLILKYYANQLKDPELQTMIQDIHDASLRLISIVNDFLDMSRLEQKRFVFNTTSFDIAELIQSILREYDATDKPKGLKLALEPSAAPLTVFADADRTRQVLVNLIGNAIKYTDTGSVMIRLILAGSKVKISVIDTGRGIPEPSHHLLFRKFQQAADNILTRDNTQSTGLGLYIAKLIVEGMGGKIYLERSVVNKGSVFTFELPTASTPMVHG